jgi:hypothetical protein
MKGLGKYLLVLLVVLSGKATAQYMDTLRHAFAGKKSLDLGFDSRNSFVDNNLVGIESIKLGVSFSDKIAVGGGYAWLNSKTPIFQTYHFYDADLKRDTFLTQRLAFSYVRFYVNYIYYKSRRWEFSIPLQVGLGRMGFKSHYMGSEHLSDQGLCFLYEPEVDVKFKLLRWLGVEGDVGYRFVFRQNKFIKNTFNSPLISMGVFLDWSELALMAFPKKEWVQKKFGPSEW